MKAWIKRLTLTRFVAVFTLFALSSGVHAQETQLLIGSSAEASGLDPRVSVDIYSFERIGVMLEPLLVFGTDLGLEPRLATDWEFSEDALTLTFSLRDDVLFHDGEPLTAEDVRYTFEWVLNPDNAASNRSLYAAIESIETPDDTTVVMNLSEPNSFLLNNIARMPIVPAHHGDRDDFNENPVGTGPFMLESWSRDDRMVLRAFEDYWGGRAQVDMVEFRPIPEDGTRLLAFEGRQLDMYQGGMVPSELNRLIDDPNFVVDRAPSAGYLYLGMNLINEPLGDVRVRQAISHLIPREAIVERILEGIGEPGISMILPDMPWFNPDVMRFDYDPERAQELLEDAGIEAGVSLRLYADEDPVSGQIAEIMQAELAQLGIALSITLEEFGTFLNRVMESDDYDLFLLTWNGQLDPDRAMHRQFHSQGSFNNLVNYANDRVDELLDQGRLIAPDSEASIEIYQEAQAIVVEEAPYAFIYYLEEIAVHHPNIEGWSVHPYNAATFQNLHLVTKTE